MSLMFNSNGLNLMETRLGNRGGAAQQDRMIKDKRRTLDRVVLYSYQGAKVQRSSDLEPARALINPNKVLQDYDEKVISIGYEYGYQVGDIFEWVNTGTKWLIYLQDLTELAYFRGDIRRCSYEISWKDDEGILHKTYGAIQGPKDSNIGSVKTGHTTILDIPNYSISLLLPKNEEVIKYFQRYTRFMLKINEFEGPLCWSVEAIDSISTPGIIQVYAKEDYINSNSDNADEGIIGDLVEIPKEQESEIIGDKFIKPKRTYEFTYSGSEVASWFYDSKLPIESTINGNSIKIKWISPYSGQFILKYGTIETTIVVESIF